jgi:hypothetical protein
MEDVEEGLSDAQAQCGGKSCDSRTKLSLELNCYCTSGLYTYETSTRSRTTSAANHKNYRTYK